MTFPLTLSIWNPVADNFYDMFFEKDASISSIADIKDLKADIHPAADITPSCDVNSAYYLAGIRSSGVFPDLELEVTLDGVPVLTQDLSRPLPLSLPWAQSRELFWAAPEGCRKDPKKKEFLGYFLPTLTHIKAFVKAKKPLTSPIYLRLDFVLGTYKTVNP